MARIYYPKAISDLVDSGEVEKELVHRAGRSFVWAAENELLEDFEYLVDFAKKSGVNNIRVKDLLMELMIRLRRNQESKIQDLLNEFEETFEEQKVALADLASKFERDASIIRKIVSNNISIPSGQSEAFKPEQSAVREVETSIHPETVEVQKPAQVSAPKPQQSSVGSNTAFDDDNFDDFGG